MQGLVLQLEKRMHDQESKSEKRERVVKESGDLSERAETATPTRPCRRLACPLLIDICCFLSFYRYLAQNVTHEYL